MFSVDNQLIWLQVGLTSILWVIGARTETCTFSGESYSAGESWKPLLINQGSAYCINCTCLQDGRVTCSSSQCDNLPCAHPVDVPGQCCKACSGEVPEMSSVELQRPSKNDRQLNCEHNGYIYEDGQQFSSNKTALVPQNKNQCVQCVCAKSKVLCHLKTCSSFRCHQKDVVDCCAKACDGCTYDNTFYRHGQSWHPLVSPFGLVKCVKCKCQNGKTICHRVECPSETELPCEKPVQLPGECCKSCPRGLSKNSSSTKKPMISTQNVVVEREVTVPSVQMCLPINHSIIAYESSQDDSSQTKSYAFEMLTNSIVESHFWNFKAGKLSFSIKKIPVKEFQAQRNNMQILGGTNQNNLQKFTKREKKIKKQCHRKCETRIKQLIRILKIKKIQYRKKCNSKEREIF